MLRVYLAELRDSWSAWLGVSLAFIVTNLSFVMSSLVLVAGWAAVGDGLMPMEASGEYTLVPISNYAFSGMVGLTVIATSASMVVDSRRGNLARLAVTGAEPKQIVRSVMGQLIIVSLACALVADVIALATIQPWLHFLATGTDSGEAVIVIVPAVYDIGVMVLANLGVVLVALIGGYGQARRAAAIPPVEAMRQAAAESVQRMTWLRWVGAGLAVLAIGALFATIPMLVQMSGKEAFSNVMTFGLGALVASVVVVAALAPAVISPLARGWTALVPSKDPAWQIARKNVYVRGTRFSRSVIPITFTVGLMLGLLCIEPTIMATGATKFGVTGLDKSGLGAFMSLLGPALLVALAGGIGNLFMMSKQRDAELALVGISGATPAQRQVIPLLEAVILTVTATMLALVAFGVMAAYFVVGFGALGFQAVIVIPPVAWLAGVGGTLLIMMAATHIPTLGALKLPEPRVVARLAAE